MPRKKSDVNTQECEPIAGLELPFENALSGLEEIVKELEGGELSLEDSLTQFAEGVRLSQICLHKLEAAEKEIDKVLYMSQGKWTEKPLDLQED